MRAIVALDWDGTLCGGFTVVEWAAFLHSHGAFRADTLADMTAAIDRYRRGEVTYAHIADVVPRVYVGGLRGLPTADAAALADAFVADPTFTARWSDLVPVLDGFLRAHPRLAPVFVSGAPQEVLERVAAAAVAGAEVHAIRADAVDGRYTGALVDNPAERHRKVRLVAELVARAPIALAAGDTASDEPMLDAARRRLVVGPHLRGRWPAPATVEVDGLRLTAAERAAVGELLARVADDVPGPATPA